MSNNEPYVDWTPAAIGVLIFAFMLLVVALPVDHHSDVTQDTIYRDGSNHCYREVSRAAGKGHVYDKVPTTCPEDLKP